MKATLMKAPEEIRAETWFSPGELCVTLKGSDSNQIARELLQLLLSYRSKAKCSPWVQTPAWSDSLILNLDQQVPLKLTPSCPSENQSLPIHPDEMKHLQQHNLKPYATGPDRNPFSDLFFTCGDLIYEPLPDFSEEADFQFEIHGVYQSEGKVFRFFQTYQDLLLGSDAFKNLKRATFSDETKFPSYFFLMNSLKKDETVVPLYIEARNPEVFREENSL